MKLLIKRNTGEEMLVSDDIVEVVRCKDCKHSALTSMDGELYCFQKNKIVRCEDSCSCKKGE